jgi:adenylylsulfate kinase
VDASVETCETRDVKGLYNLARKGSIPNFTGISYGSEIPISPDIHIRTDSFTVEESIQQIADYLLEQQYI